MNPKKRAENRELNATTTSTKNNYEATKLNYKWKSKSMFVENISA